MNPLLILSFDGATFDIIDFHRDRLPTLSNLIETEYAADLESTQPAITSVAWPAFVTGQNPSHFGLFDFPDCDPSTFEISINDVRKLEFDFFWDYLDAEVGIASVPMVLYRGVRSFTDVVPTLAYFIGGQVPGKMDEDPITEAIVSDTEPTLADIDIPERTHIRGRILMLKQLDQI